MNPNRPHVVLDTMQVSPFLIGFAAFVFLTLSTSIVVVFALSFRAFVTG
jgi:hypothetical protein